MIATEIDEKNNEAAKRHKHNKEAMQFHCSVVWDAVLAHR